MPPTLPADAAPAIDDVVAPAVLEAAAFATLLRQRGYSEASIATYQRIVRRWAASGQTVRAWLTALQDSSRTTTPQGGGLPTTNATSAAKALRLYLQLVAEQEGRASADPEELLAARPPRTHRYRKHRRAPLSPAEEARVRAVLAAPPAQLLPPVAVAAQLMLDLGLRLEEVLDLQLADLSPADESGPVLIVREGKGRSLAAGDPPARLGLPPALVGALAGYLRGWRAGRPGPWLFPSPRPGRHGAAPGAATWTDRGMRAAISRLGVLAGMSPAREGADGVEAGLHPHRLRHTLATRLAEAGASREEIRIVLRHREPGVTAGYIHPGPEHVRAVLARLDAARNNGLTAGPGTTGRAA